MDEKFRKGYSAQDAFEQKEWEASELFDTIENSVWDLWCDLRDFRVMMRNIEINRTLLDKH